MEQTLKPRTMRILLRFVLAAKRGRTRTAELLLESGAELKSRDASRRTCIHLAVIYERLETLRMLLNREQGQLINERDKDLRTPLHYAASLGSLKVKVKFRCHKVLFQKLLCIQFRSVNLRNEREAPESWPQNS